MADDIFMTYDNFLALAKNCMAKEEEILSVSSVIFRVVEDEKRHMFPLKKDLTPDRIELLPDCLDNDKMTTEEKIEAIKKLGGIYLKTENDPLSDSGILKSVVVNKNSFNLDEKGNLIVPKNVWNFEEYKNAISNYVSVSRYISDVFSMGYSYVRIVNPTSAKFDSFERNIIPEIKKNLKQVTGSPVKGIMNLIKGKDLMNLKLTCAIFKMMYDRKLVSDDDFIKTLELDRNLIGVWYAGDIKDKVKRKVLAYAVEHAKEIMNGEYLAFATATAQFLVEEGIHEVVLPTFLVSTEPVEAFKTALIKSGDTVIRKIKDTEMNEFKDNYMPKNIKDAVDNAKKVARDDERKRADEEEERKRQMEEAEKDRVLLMLANGMEEGPRRSRPGRTAIPGRPFDRKRPLRSNNTGNMSGSNPFA